MHVANNVNLHSVIYFHLQVYKSMLELRVTYALTLGLLLFPGVQSTLRRNAVRSQRKIKKKNSFVTGQNNVSANLLKNSCTVLGFCRTF